ncbi:MAG: hypothetical protein HY862_06125 [Chloroflexi bacterium]|nr:hypothetical protein [Chloroflexota bacterium]
MLGSAVLDTAIGLIFIFFIFGTMCSGAFTMISRGLEMRGKLLQQGLLYLLDEDVQKQIMDHPLIKSTRLKQGNMTVETKFWQFLRRIPLLSSLFPTRTLLTYNPNPDYIAPSTFSRALLDVIIATGEDIQKQNPNAHYSIDDLATLFASNLGETLQEKKVKEQAINYVRYKLGTLIDQNESSVIDGVDRLIIEVGVKDPKVCDEIRFQVRNAFTYRAEVLDLITLGLTEIKLPEQTKEFFQRQIELIIRQQGLNEKIETTKEKFDEVVFGVENWYNRAMDSLTTIFKRTSQAWIFAIATVLAVVFNINTINIAQSLWTNTTVRDSVVATAETRVQEEQQATNGEEKVNPVTIFREDLASLQIPVGWTKTELKSLHLPTGLAQSSDSQRPKTTPFKAVVGLSLTVIAGVIGAPFWFDLLNRLLNFRGGAKSNSKDEETTSN